MTVMKKGEEVETEVNKQTHTVYTDSTVMPEEKRYYRVFAINLRGQSDQSDVASATTGEAPPNTAPTAGAAIPDQTVRVDATVMVQSTITDADTDDTLTWSAMSNMPTYATAEVDTMGMVTITGVAEGMAIITVTATDGIESDMQTIDVTVGAADTSLQAIPNSSISVTNNANGSITVSWTGGDNATSFIVVAAELGSDPFVYESTTVSDGTARTAAIPGLSSGSNYLIIVIALQGRASSTVFCRA